MSCQTGEQGRVCLQWYSKAKVTWFMPYYNEVSNNGMNILSLEPLGREV